MHAAGAGRVRLRARALVKAQAQNHVRVYSGLAGDAPWRVCCVSAECQSESRMAATVAGGSPTLIASAAPRWR